MEPKEYPNTLTYETDMLEINNIAIHLSLKRIEQSIYLRVYQRNQALIRDLIDDYESAEPIRENYFSVMIGEYPELCNNILFLGKPNQRRANKTAVWELCYNVEAQAYFERVSKTLLDIFTITEEEGAFKSVPDQDFLKEFL